MPAMPHISSTLLQTERPADAALDVRPEHGHPRILSQRTRSRAGTPHAPSPSNWHYVPVDCARCRVYGVLAAKEAPRCSPRVVWSLISDQPKQAITSWSKECARWKLEQGSASWLPSAWRCSSPREPAR